MPAADGAPVTVRLAPLDDEASQALVAAQRVELAGRYGEPLRAMGRRLDPADFAPPRGAFVLALVGDQPVACGGLRPGDEAGVAEVKRMYTAPEARGRGVGRAVLAALEEQAVALGYRAVQLETGVRQPEAIALYEHAGYERVPNYGRYADRHDSVCFRRSLDASPPAR